MVLEATLICLDNSEYSRNGDYVPSRLDAQCDAANLICGAKTAQNPENSVGLLTTADDRVVVRVAPTQDLGRILQGLHDIPVRGEANIVRAIQTAQLALKHRMNKNQRQRIILFVGSPVSASEKQLRSIGRVLKKNNVALDIVSFGETELNSAKLNRLYNEVNSNNTSRFVEYPSDSTRLLSDMLMSSPIVRDAESDMGDGSGAHGGGAGTGAGDGGFPGSDVGVDPRADPELYMALQISLQEERTRQARAAADAAARDRSTVESGGEQQGEPSSTSHPVGVEDTMAMSSTFSTSAQEILAMEDIDDELRQALLISLNDFQTGPEQEEGTSASSFQPLADGDASAVSSPAPISNADSAHPGQTSSQNALSLATMSREVVGGGDMVLISPNEAGDPSGVSAAAVNATSDPIQNPLITTPQPDLTTIASENPSAVALIQQLLGMPGVDVTDPRLLEALQRVAEPLGRSGESASGETETPSSESRTTGSGTHNLSGHDTTKADGPSGDETKNE